MPQLSAQSDGFAFNFIEKTDNENHFDDEPDTKYVGDVAFISLSEPVT